MTERNNIEEYILESKKEMLVTMDVAYNLAIRRSNVPEATLNQISYTLLNSCLRYHKYIKAVGINHVRIKIGSKIDKPKELLGEAYDRFGGFCGTIIMIAEGIKSETIQSLYELDSKPNIMELYRDNGSSIFEQGTPIREVVKRMAESNKKCKNK